MDDAVLTTDQTTDPTQTCTEPLPLLDDAVLRTVIATAPDGIAVLERGTGRPVLVNPAARDLLGARGGERTIERERHPLGPAGSGAGADLEVVHLRDVTRARQQERQLTAFSATCASIAFAGSLSTVLDRLAKEVKGATGMFACTFLLVDDAGHLRQAGAADESYPGVEDYAERIDRCRALGAPLLSHAALEAGRPLVVEHWRQQTLADGRFAPIHDITARASWDALATVPVISRGQVLGVMNGFYLVGTQPRQEDVAFLAAVADLAAVAVENARLLGAVESKAALEERHLLARELHDSVSQALFSLTLQARALEIGVEAGGVERAALLRGLGQVRELTEGALAEMRALIFQLRPAALHEEGLVSAVRGHGRAVAAREGLEVLVVADDAGWELDAAVEEQVFRVVQEALSNAVKHAGATSVTIRLGTAPASPRSLELDVVDDGSGFDTGVEHPGHLGLESMAERVAQVGGTLVVESSPGRTAVRACVPDVVGTAAGGVGRG